MRKATHNNQSEVLATPSKEIGRIQDSAADLLAHVNREDALRRNTTARKSRAPAACGVDAMGSGVSGLIALSG